jgi:hypothetical protein
MPLPENDLRVFLNMAKDNALAVFKKKAVGDVSSEYVKDCVERLKKKKI